MANLLQSGMAWLDAQLVDHASSAVAYSRGASTVGIAATIGRHKPYDAGQEENSLYGFEMRLTFRRDALASLGLPQRGDVATITVGGVTSRYDVLPIDGERWWRDSDAFGNRIEVLVKLAERTT